MPDIWPFFCFVVVVLQDVHSSSLQERSNATCATTSGRSAEVRVMCQWWAMVMLT